MKNILSALLLSLSCSAAFCAPLPRFPMGRSLRLPSIPMRIAGVGYRPVRADIPERVWEGLIQAIGEQSEQGKEAFGGDLVPSRELGEREIYELLAHKAPETRSGLSTEQRAALWSAAASHPVAGLPALAKYDPTGIIGFCFGRATAVQLMARAMGLKQESIRKLFVSGDLRSGEAPQWRFHVATLVHGDDGKWYAIDPIFPAPMEAADWNAQVRAIWDKAGKAKFYLSGADTAIPEIRTVPDIDKETGERLIELSFNPVGRSGFAPVSGYGPNVFVLSSAQEKVHFQADDFDFRQITINGTLYHYNDYYVDLMQSLLHPLAPMSSPAPKAMPAESLAPKDIRQAPLGLRLP